MGFSVKFNWVLQIDPPGDLRPGNSYPFEKSGNRVFPIDVPIDLIDGERNAIAKIKIRTFTNHSGATNGKFEVVKIYESKEKAVLSTYWRENQ